MSKQLAMVEPLEARSLFSVMPLAPYSHAAARADGAVQAHERASLETQKPLKKPHSVLGLWIGSYTVKGFLFHAKYDLDVEFTQVGKTFAVGTLTIEDEDWHGRWTGVTLSNGQFGYTLRRHGNKIELTGQLDGKSHFAWGRLKVDWGFHDDKGDFSLRKLA
jgi:hypothetical protein